LDRMGAWGRNLMFAVVCAVVIVAWRLIFR
jgi:hypothetical protein